MSKISSIAGRLALVALGLCTLPVTAQIPQPQLETLFPLAVSPGSETEVTLHGIDLDGLQTLHFSRDGLTAEVQSLDPSAGPIGSATCRIRVDKDARLGPVEVRTVGYFGMSNPRWLLVDDLPSRRPVDAKLSQSEPTQLQIDQAVDARLPNEGIHHYGLTVPAGDHVVVECQADRFDSRLDANLTIYDEAGRELGKVRDSLGRDPVVELAGGKDSPRTFRIAIHDVTYRGGTQFPYRLAVHRRPLIKAAFPPVAARNQASQFKLYGWLLSRNRPQNSTGIWQSCETYRAKLIPQGEPTISPGSSLAATSARGSSIQLSTATGKSNAVVIPAPQFPVTLEKRPKNSEEPPAAVTITLPGEFVGELTSPRDRSRCTFLVNRGDQVYLSLLAERLGVADDLAMRITQTPLMTNGKWGKPQQVSADDTKFGPGNDPLVTTSDPHHTIQAKQASLVQVEIHSIFGHATESNPSVFRLVARKDRPDFRSVAIPSPPRGADNARVPISATALRSGEIRAIRVYVERLGGFEGAVEFRLRDLPPGIQSWPTRVEKGEIFADLLVAAQPQADPWHGNVQLAARAIIDGQPIERPVTWGTDQWQAPNVRIAAQKRLASQLALSISQAPSLPAQLRIATNSDGPPTSLSAQLGDTLELPLTLVRAEGFEAPVTVELHGLPDKIRLQSAAIAKSNETLQLTIPQEDVQPGEYTLVLKSRVRARMTRNPLPIQAAQAAVDEISGEQQSVRQSLKVLEAEMGKLTQDVEKQSESQKQAREHELQVRKELSVEQAKLDELQKKLETLLAEKSSQPANQAPQDWENIRKQYELSASRLADLAQAASAAAARARLAEWQHKWLAESLTQREGMFSKQQDSLQSLTEKKKTADQHLATANQQNGPRDYEFELISNPVRIEILPASQNQSVAQAGGE